MAPSLRMNASTAPRGCTYKQKRKAKVSRPASSPSVKTANPSIKSHTYIHVHRFVKTGKWGTWFNDPTIMKGRHRLYFGTYGTEILAARAQDRAALKYKPDAVKPMKELNFQEADYEDDKDLREKLTHEQFRRLLMAESRSCYNKAEPSPCWRKFLAEEKASGNLVSGSGNRFKAARTLTQVLEDLKAQHTPRATGTPNRNSGANNSLDEGPARTPEQARALHKAARAGVRRLFATEEEEVRGSSLQSSQQSSPNVERLAWKKTGKRTLRFSSPTASDNGPEHLQKKKMPMVRDSTDLSSQAVTTGTVSDEEEDIDSEVMEERGSEVTVQSPTKRTRCDIFDLINREPVCESSESVGECAPHVIDEVGNNDVMIESAFDTLARIASMAG